MPVTGLKIGYARVSTDDQDLTAQRDALAALGVDPDRLYVDHGLTGTNRDRPGLREAVAALITQFYATVLQPRLGTVNITALQKPNALLLIGRDESVKFVKELIQRLDVPVEPSTQFAVIPLKHAAASTAQATITQFFANRVGLGPKVVVTTEFRTNSLIVQAAPRDLAEVAEPVRTLGGDEPVG